MHAKITNWSLCQVVAKIFTSSYPAIFSICSKNSRIARDGKHSDQFSMTEK